VSTERHKTASVNNDRDEEDKIQHPRPSWNIVSALTRDFDIPHFVTVSDNKKQEMIITDRVGRDLAHLILIQDAPNSNTSLDNS
jgi:hypothetical protein